MTSINSKMGFKRPGKRAFMKLPRNRAEAAKITSAKCPECGLTGARAIVNRPGSVFCSWCGHVWELPA